MRELNGFSEKMMDSSQKEAGNVRVKVAVRLSRIEALRNPTRKTCPDCLKSSLTCYCVNLRPFDPGVKFVILTHPKEYKNAQGTGRIAHLCLEDSVMLRGVDFSNDERVNGLISGGKYSPVVLYPGKKSLNLDTLDEKAAADLFRAEKKPLVFVIDGTWSSAKRMMKLSSNLHGLTRICFNPREPSKYRIRVQPSSLCLSTVESVYMLIRMLESRKIIRLKDRNAPENLLKVFKSMVEKQLEFKLNPDGRGYRINGKGRPKVIRPAKKWLKRSLFYNH